MILQPYKHDCDRCMWVSWIHMPGGGKFGSDWGNVYFCPNPRQDKDYPGSIVIRFSDEASDYWSACVARSMKGSLEIPDEKTI
jgi:hypothetical protein